MVWMMDSQPLLFLLRNGAAVVLALGPALLARTLAEIPPLPLPAGGLAEEKRRLAMESPAFRRLDPLLRYAGAMVELGLSMLVEAVPQGRQWKVRLVSGQDQLLIRAGHPKGCSAPETLALAFLLGLAGAGCGAHLGRGEDAYLWIAPCALLGLALPTLRLQSIGASRLAELSRELPAAIDLTALAMNAGCDFPGALRRVVAGQQGAVTDELRQVLWSLNMGSTRKAALRAFESRAPVEEVKDLVRAIILAEEKGATVSDALSQQAKTSRERRSVRAEESAARAGTLLLLPLMLLMGCVLLILFGPLVVQSMTLGG